jgi:hypothetical protein
MAHDLPEILRIEKNPWRAVYHASRVASEESKPCRDQEHADQRCHSFRLGEYHVRSDRSCVLMRSCGCYRKRLPKQNRNRHIRHWTSHRMFSSVDEEHPIRSELMRLKYIVVDLVLFLGVAVLFACARCR